MCQRHLTSALLPLAPYIAVSAAAQSKAGSTRTNQDEALLPGHSSGVVSNRRQSLGSDNPGQFHHLIFGPSCDEAEWAIRAGDIPARRQGWT
jgi:hypothetical protein